MFDNDDGAKAIKKYVREFGDEIKRNFHLYSENEPFALEDFFSKKDKNELLRITKTDNIKKALAILYYDCGESVKSDYFKNLESATIKNLSKTIEILNKL